MRRIVIILVLFLLPVASGIAQQQASRPTRDNPQTQTQAQATAVIAGRVLTADTGRPVKHARVTVSAGGRQSRGITTDDQGRFRITELAAGSYTVTASRTGFVDAVYGQRRPLQPGTPVQLADGQEIATIDLRLVRGGLITGRVLDEDGEPLARAIVTVQRYQYVRGERQLSPAGGDQSDDRGQYRVFGLRRVSTTSAPTPAGSGKHSGADSNSSPRAAAQGRVAEAAAGSLARRQTIPSP
jgi:hypothetical protein